VQIEKKRLRLLDSKTGAKTISLSPQALALIQAIPRFSDNPHVIVGGRAGRHLVDLQRPWQRVRKAAGLEDVRLHDLRHSFASIALQEGTSLSVIGQLLGHKSTATTKRYAHLADDHISAESGKIGDLIEQAMSGKRAKT